MDNERILLGLLDAANLGSMAGLSGVAGRIMEIMGDAPNHRKELGMIARAVEAHSALHPHDPAERVIMKELAAKLREVSAVIVDGEEPKEESGVFKLK